MKKTFFAISIILIMFFEACNEDFSINAPYEDVYVLNCILRNDNSLQYAIISKNTLTENGIPPASKSAAQNIQGANIKISHNNSEYIMRDTSIDLTNAGNTLVNCYYVKDLVLNPGQAVNIEASVPGGTKLESKIQIPSISWSTFSGKFPQVHQSGYQKTPYYKWSWGGNSKDAANILSLPQLEIYYQKYEDGKYIDKKILVPLAQYFIYDELNNTIPVNVEISFNNYCVTTLETVNKTMQEISGDDPDKNNYIINKVLFTVISLGPDLSRFYSAYHTYEEDFTIKLRQTDFSNVEGGKGVFGVNYKFTRLLIVDRLYIYSFGYQYDPT